MVVGGMWFFFLQWDFPSMKPLTNSNISESFSNIFHTNIIMNSKLILKVASLFTWDFKVQNLIK